MDVDLREQLETRYQRFATFVNEDVAHLNGAVAALVARYRRDGLTEEERAGGSENAVRWADARGQSHTAQITFVSLWSGLETYVEDLWIDAARNVSIADTQLKKVKASIIEVHELAEEERYRKVWENVDTPKRFGVDRYSTVFEKIGVGVTMRNLVALGQSLLRPPDGTPVDDHWMVTTLHELRALRNVIVHRGGVVDQRLAEIDPSRWRIGETSIFARTV